MKQKSKTHDSQAFYLVLKYKLLRRDDKFQSVFLKEMEQLTLWLSQRIQLLHTVWHAQYRCETRCSVRRLEQQQLQNLRPRWPHAALLESTAFD